MPRASRSSQPHSSDELPSDLPERPSKSQRKRDMTALQDLGEELVALNRDQLASVEMSEDLQRAVHEARSITSHEGRRRQMQYIGRIMRNEETDGIRLALDGFKGQSRAHTDALHTLERWRERLLADDPVLTIFASEYPAALNPATMKELRSTIRMARKEREEVRPPRHYRELFQILKSIVGETP